ncbi:DUF5696 domain-containing protein [Paenibacillus aceti]|uniref:Uncharacterized protein n=1 Tax=Paenibacillus aceti TaxID=1820010 RepID=A0ABQ1W750_9BACL|nr:DUF5696 domain-containing protein [Paenibacillus aceti]GGG18501.1 hypothetical protein GCM10010913_45840 [Paenibacillus aceti]
MGIRRKWVILLCCSLLLAAGIGSGGAGNTIRAEEVSAAAEIQTQDGVKAADFSVKESDVGAKQSSAVAKPTELPELPQGADLVAENENLQLYLNSKTTVLSVRDKRTGQLWSSNPADRDQDKIAKAANRSDLDSQLILSYFNDKGHESLINNAAESITKGQFEIEQLPQGVKITYEIGSSEQGLGAIPKVISKERFEQRILEQISDESMRSRLRNRFFYNEEKQQYERKEMQDYIVKDVVEILESIGYTAEEAKQNSSAADGDTVVKESAAPRFIVPLVYELDGPQLLARIDTEDVQDTEAFPLHTIQLLPFFGAAGLEEEGYMLVPDGSGALFELNQNHAGARAYELPLYGEDATPKGNELIQAQYKEISRLPVFGLKRGDEALLAIIEEGDAQASIHAEPSGRLNSYNRVNASFRMKDMEPVQFRAGSVTRQIPKYSAMYSQGIAIRYSFLSGAKANYVGMAERYRQYLIQQHGLTPLPENGELPFVVELVGAIPVRKTFLGIPYETVEAVTTYSEAIEILEQLQQQGIHRIQLKYSGWFNGGYYHSLPSRVKPERVLGGAKGLEKLIEYTKEHQIELYPDVAFQRVYKNGKGFKAQRDSTRFLNRKGASRQAVDLVTTNLAERLYYLLAPDKLKSITDAFVNHITPYPIRSLSLRDLGEELNSSVAPEKTTSRQEVQSLVTDSLEKMKTEMERLMISGGNAYSLPYASTIVNAPLRSSRFNIETEEVPFYSIVIHGYMDYAGRPLNLEQDQDPRVSLLRILETGAVPAYQWFYADPAMIRDTKLNGLYSASYMNWIDEAAQGYQEMNEVLGEVRNQPITNHRRLQEQVYETTYGQGLRVLVNYNRVAVTVDGMTIEALGYRVTGGGEA